jgi:hypothetical protein
MTAKNLTIEHCLVVMSGDTVLIDAKDEKLIQSLARQIDRGIGLTDRQLNLARKKLDEYTDQLTQQEIDVNQAKQNIKLPVRQIDRSRWIRFAESDEGAKIQVRFAFQKKLIQAIDSVKKQIPSSQRTYDPDTKTHTFDYSESNLYEIVTAFKLYDFDVDEDILDLYRDLCELDPSDVVPGIYGFETRNLPGRAVDLLEQEIGKPTANTLALYKDRSLKYGLHYFDREALHASMENLSSLAQQIASRSQPSVAIENNRYTIESIVLALEELGRLPVLIVVPGETADDSVVECHKSLRNIISPEDTSVMFRLDNTELGAGFNQWIKDNRIANSLDFEKKIVYTLDNRIPKPVLNSEWQPNTVISLAKSTMLVSMRKILNYYADRDLLIHYENEQGQMLRNAFDMERIE